jgi:hypothetical protein
MKQYVFEVLEEVQKASKKEDKIKILKENETWALKDIIRGSMDKNVVWNLPPGSPPYTASGEHNHPSNLIGQNKQFKYFVKGGPGDKLPSFKRETIFISVIESVHPKDAQLVIDMVNKEKPAGITKALVKEAFPGLLQD